MSLTIGANISSLKAQRRLAEADIAQLQSYTRLSSGLRINKASDDPAGLAVSSQLSSNNRVFTQGVRNLSDGLSALNIADSALAEVSDIVIRLKELAEQSANGSYSNTQRTAIDAEAQALDDEFQRIINSAKFNGRSLFDLSNTELRLQAGYGTNGSIASTLTSETLAGTGSFSASSTLAAGDGATEVRIGDLNNDGINDIISGHYWENTIGVYLGTGGGTFAARQTFYSGSRPRSVNLADFNSDGVLDVVSADGLGDTVTLFLGNGNGTFGVGVSFDAGDDPASITIADFNEDGDVDIVVSSYGDYHLNILLGTGTGSFAPRVSYLVGTHPDSVTTADFNNDGFLDLVSGDLSDNKISVLLGTGTGSFGTAVSYSSGAGPVNVATGDVNNDGNSDIVTANKDASTVSVFLGVGNGTFSASTPFSVGTDPRGVILEDLNSDGHLDIATANQVDNNVTVLLGNGTGVFNSVTSFSMGIGSTPDFVTVGDVNGDGIVDLLTANFGGDSVGILIASTSMTSETPSLQSFSLTTAAEAREALTMFDDNLDSLTLQRGKLGAFQSRILSAINTTQASADTSLAAATRIRDADIAAEASNLVRTGVLRDAATAVLAQANQIPAIVLTLLNRA